MEIKFTASVLEALSYALRLTSGNLYVHRKGRHCDLPQGVRVQAPSWWSFDFFHRITATPIRRTKREEPGPDSIGHWELARTVAFWHWGQRLLVIDLVGMKLDGEDRGHEPLRRAAAAPQRGVQPRIHRPGPHGEG